MKKNAISMMIVKLSGSFSLRRWVVPLYHFAMGLSVTSP
jgi:hypothetical protein